MPRLLSPRRARMYLQMTNYYKMWFSWLFYPISLLLLIEKLSRFSYQTQLNRIMHVSTFVLLALSDGARYWLGTTGTLRQQVFHLTAFLFLTFCPFVPALLFFCFFSEHLVSFDSIIGCCELVFVILETLLAIVVLRELLRHETTRFVRLREVVKEQRHGEQVVEREYSMPPMATAC